MLNTIGRYWHTLRHLRPVQFYGRLWFRLARPRVDLARAPMPRAVAGRWQPPAQRKRSLLAPDSFVFLGQPGALADIGWDGPQRDKLWRYSQHYFDDLNAEGSVERSQWHRGLLEDWADRNPPGRGTAWEPYPTSLRIVNWIKWSLAGNSLPPGCVQSLAVQVRWLTRRLEVHLLGNHLFANAKALVFAGLFFEGPEARKWLVKGLRIIERELPEQVLPDGGNFERSPMYHALFLEDLLDLINAADAWPKQVPAELAGRWREVAGHMLTWLEGLLHPDGQIALFNDAAFGIAPAPSELRAYAKRLQIDPPQLAVPQAPALQGWRDSGYVRMSSRQAVALLDVAPVGPDYLPGHAHADTLSFELSVAGQRVIVNGGTSRYGTGPDRMRERSTASHSTVEVAGRNSSEVWGGFRVARRARPFGLESGGDSSSVWVACSHDGYRHLAGQPVHRRRWFMDEEGMTVTDTVDRNTGQGRHQAVARFILHPDVQVAAAGAGTWQLTLPGGQVLVMTFEGGRVQQEPARYAPAFGQVLATHCLAVQLLEGRAETRFAWG